MHISGCDVQFLHSIPFVAVHQGFLSSHFLTQSEHTQAQEVSKGHRQDSWSKLYKGTFQAIKCCAQQQKLRERGRQAGLPHVSQETFTGASQKWLDICLLMGNSESSPNFVLLWNTAFSFYIELSFSQSMIYHFL